MSNRKDSHDNAAVVLEITFRDLPVDLRSDCGGRVARWDTDGLASGERGSYPEAHEDAEETDSVAHEHPDTDEPSDVNEHAPAD
jgi:hypothetical protein